MLIVAIGVLTLITLIGIAFATLMRLERNATENYILGERANELVNSGVAAVIARLKGSENYFHFTPFNASWLYQVQTRFGKQMAAGPWNRRREASAKATPTPSVEGEVFFDDDRLIAGRYYYETKVLDCASQININVNSYSLPMMLDHLGEAIRRSQLLLVRVNRPPGLFKIPPPSLGDSNPALPF